MLRPAYLICSPILAPHLAPVYRLLALIVAGIALVYGGVA